jgi:hypothetical protein
MSSRYVAAARAALQNTTQHLRGTPPWVRARNNLERALSELREPAPPVQDRVELFTSGAIALCIEVIRMEDGKLDDDIIRAAWWVINGAMFVGNANDPRELESVRLGVQSNLIELSSWELHFSPLRAGGRFMNNAFMCIISSAARDEFANRVLAADVIEPCLALIRAANMTSDLHVSILDAALIVVAYLSFTRRETVRATVGIEDAITPLIRLLHRRDDPILMRSGFSAARLLIRLMGKEEISRVRRRNPIILDSYHDIMLKVLESGPEHGFRAYEGRWNLSGLALDLSLLSLGDVGKAQLARFVHPVLDMLSLYGKDNAVLVHFGLVFLSQIVSNHECLRELKVGKPKLYMIQSFLCANRHTEAGMLALLSHVVNPIDKPLCLRRDDAGCMKMAYYEDDGGEGTM